MTAPSIVEIDEKLLKKSPLPLPGGDTDKDERGRVIVVGGSARVPGAPILSGLAALRAGAGKVQLAVPKSLATNIGVAFPEVGVAGFGETEAGEPWPESCNEVCDIVDQADAALVGPGLMDERAAQALTTGLLTRTTKPIFVLDAMAVTGFAGDSEALACFPNRIVITPHAGEMAALTGSSKENVQRDPISIAVKTARTLNCVVVLKGATTHIATADGQVFRHAGGVVGLATSGSGDVLAGLLAALISRGTPVVQACAWSVFAHAQAGKNLTQKLGALGLIAREIADEIPLVFKSMI